MKKIDFTTMEPIWLGDLVGHIEDSKNGKWYKLGDGGRNYNFDGYRWISKDIVNLITEETVKVVKKPTKDFLEEAEKNENWKADSPYFEWCYICDKIEDQWLKDEINNPEGRTMMIGELGPIFFKAKENRLRKKILACCL